MKIGWGRHTARTGAELCVQKLSEKREKGGYFELLDLDERIILKWTITIHSCVIS
jgi:hypothetical protein